MLNLEILRPSWIRKVLAFTALHAERLVELKVRIEQSPFASAAASPRPWLPYIG
jgi:hypothetical protein